MPTEYNNVHRFLLRTVISRGVLNQNEAQQALVNYCGGDDSEFELKDLVKQVNVEIKQFQQEIKFARDELTDENVIIFLNLGYDDATKAQAVFTATELEYFRLLIEQIMTTESRQVTGIHAINLVNQLKSSFTKTDAQKVLKTWCNMKYLDNENNNYALGVRAIHEFEGYLRQNMPDTIEECVLCKQIVFRGYNCPACVKAVHTRCLNVFLEKTQKWPCCKADFHRSQLDEINNKEHSRLAIAHSQVQEPEENTMEATVRLEGSEDSQMELTQDIIPEISQRVTRKRKRE